MRPTCRAWGVCSASATSSGPTPPRSRPATGRRSRAAGSQAAPCSTCRSRNGPRPSSPSRTSSRPASSSRRRSSACGCPTTSASPGFDGVDLPWLPHRITTMDQQGREKGRLLGTPRAQAARRHATRAASPSRSCCGSARRPLPHPDGGPRAPGPAGSRREKGHPAYLEELSYPCCIPALGEFGEVPPRGVPTASVCRGRRQPEIAPSRGGRARGRHLLDLTDAVDVRRQAPLDDERDDGEQGAPADEERDVDQAEVAADEEARDDRTDDERDREHRAS